MKKQYLYMLGVFVLGLVYVPVKNALGGGFLFALAMIGAAVCIAWLAHRFGK